MTADDRDSVNSVIEEDGLHGALLYAAKRLAAESGMNDARHVRIRRMMLLIIRESSQRLVLDVKRARQLARCHASGLKTFAVVHPKKVTQR